MDLLVAAHADTASVNPAESIESLLQQGFDLEMRRVERFENSPGFAMGMHRLRSGSYTIV